MASINYTTPSEGAAAAWAGDFLTQRDRVLVSGGLLDASAFSEVPEQGGRKFVESGTLVSRSYADEEAGAGFHPYEDGDEQAFLTIHDCYDATDDPSVTFYRPGSLVYSRHLPAASRATAALANIRRFYPTARGEA